MKGKVTLDEAKAALNRYREQINPVLITLRSTLPEGTTDVATVHRDYAFVTRVNVSTPYDSSSPKIFSGDEEELFSLCQEAIDYSLTAHLPDPSKSIGENSIDSILRVEKNPFVLVTFDERSRRYILRTTQHKGDLDRGELRTSEHTVFTAYQHTDILNGTDFYSVTDDKAGQRNSLVRYLFSSFSRVFH
ncbi:MAG: hypothetical protein IIA87_03815 [Nanoarchaeota archaeon]|nr:hypothetical protein [Nanoarchaeota archaeon]